MSHFAIVTVLAVSFVLAQAVPIALPSIPSGNGTVGSVVGLVQASKWFLGPSQIIDQKFAIKNLLSPSIIGASSDRCRAGFAGCPGIEH